MSILLEKGLLFKYMPYNQYLFNLLVNGEFWLNSPDKLNDPFEGDFRINDINKYHNDIFIKKLLGFNWKNIIDDFRCEDELDKALNDVSYFSNILYEYINGLVRTKFGVSCFSENSSSVKMWSHYADSHKGVCLVFDEKKLKESVLRERHGVLFEKVDYCKTLPFIDIINHDADEDGDNYIGIPNEKSFLFNKLDSWGEEKEVRLLVEKEFDVFPDRRLKYGKASLTGIIFGSRIEGGNLATIVNLINGSDQKGKVKFYKASKDPIKSSVIIEDYKIKSMNRAERNLLATLK